MRRKKRLCVLTATVMTMMGGIGPRAYAAVPPAVNLENEADEPAGAEDKPEATVPPGQADDGNGKKAEPEQETPDEPGQPEEPEEAGTESVTEKPDVTEDPKGSEETETPEATEEAAETETPEVTEEAAETETPEVTEETAETETPEVTGKAEENGTPEVTEQPEETKVPDVTDKPEAAGEPEVTEKPEEPETPETTKIPEITGRPDVTEKADPETPVPEEKTEKAVAVAAPTEKATEKENKTEENKPKAGSGPAEEEEPIKEKEKPKEEKPIKEKEKLKEEKPIKETGKATETGEVKKAGPEKNTEESKTGESAKKAEPAEKTEQVETAEPELSVRLPEQKDAPELRIDGVRDRATSSSPVELSVHIKDRDSAAADIRAVIKDTESGRTIEGTTVKRKDGYKVTFPKVTDDGHYQMTVQTRDDNGKVSSEKKVAFTVNQHGGAAYLATEDLAGARVNRSVSPEFVIADVDEQAGLRATVNGHTVGASYNKEGKLVLDRAITKEGRYVVRVEGKDSSGHEIRSKPVEFVIDKTKPRVWMKTKETQKGLMVEIFHDVPEDNIESVTVDGVRVSASNYTDKKGQNRLLLNKEGLHTVGVSVRDAAGNKTQLTRTFRGSSLHKAGKNKGHLKTRRTVAATAATAAAGAALLGYLLLRHRLFMK